MRDAPGPRRAAADDPGKAPPAGSPAGGPRAADWCPHEPGGCPDCKFIEDTFQVLRAFNAASGDVHASPPPVREAVTMLCDALFRLYREKRDSPRQVETFPDGSVRLTRAGAPPPGPAAA